MVIFYFTIIFILSLFQPIIKGMETSIEQYQSPLFPAGMPSDPVCIILRSLVQLDAKEYRKTRTKNQAVENQKLHDLHKDYLSFSKSVENLLNACPSVIQMIAQINQENPFFLSRLRTHFFIKAHICPSGQFIAEFLNDFNSHVHRDRLHNAFYSLTSSKRFDFISPLRWEEAAIDKVPFGYNILFMRHHKQYNANRLQFIPNENSYIQIASILCNPYLTIKTKNKKIKNYLLSIDVNKNYKDLLLERTNQLKAKIKKRGGINKSLNIIIYYLLKSKECPYWVGKGNKKILYYYFEKDLNNPRLNLTSLTSFLKNEIEKLLNPKDELIHPYQFEDSQAILLDTLKKINPKAVSLIRGIFQHHSVITILRIFTYFPDYWKAIDNYMKFLNDTHEIFYSQHFEKLITYAPEFDSVYKKDFNEFVRLLERDLTNRYYPKIRKAKLKK